MARTPSKTRVKIQMALVANRHMMILIASWFSINFAVLMAITGLDVLQSVRYLFYVDELDTGFGRFYATYSEWVVFGLLIGLVTVDAFRNYDPGRTCEILASRQKHHAIIVGYDHLGIRLHAYLKQRNIPCTIVSADKAALSEVHEKEEPAVLYNELDEEFLKKVNLSRARYLFLLDENLVLDLKLVMLAAKTGSKAKIAVRCFDEAFGKVFESYGAKIVSASSATAKVVFKDHLASLNLEELHVIGFNHFAARACTVAANNGIKCTLVSDKLDAILFVNKLSNSKRQRITLHRGNHVDHQVLDAVGVFSSKAVIIAVETDDVILVARDIKETNPGAVVIARTFSDEIEQVLENLGVVPVSTSKHALTTQIVPLLG